MNERSQVGQSLIARNPFSLISLVRHDLRPEDRRWFARCCGDYLRAFPALRMDMFRVAMMLCLMWPAESPWLVGLIVTGCGMIGVFHVGLRRRVAQPDPDLIALLGNVGTLIALRSAWWFCVVLASTIIVPSEHLGALLALCLLTAAIDGLVAMSLPLHALAASTSSLAALTIGLAVREGWAALPSAVSLVVFALFMHWTIFNLYYMFTTRRIRTRRLSESNETIRLLLNQYDTEGSDWLYEVDLNGCIRHPSARFCEAAGLNYAELDGLPLTSLVGKPDDGPDLGALFAGRQPFRNLEVPVRCASGERWWSLNGRPIEQIYDQQAGWRGFIADITADREAKAKVNFLAHYDMLTKLPNRTLFNATLERAFSRKLENSLIGLMYIDLDHFKAINDGQGHAAGDKVLVEVSSRIEASVRPRDMVARLGGDEFVVLLPDLPSRDAAQDIAQRILDVVGDVIEVDDQQLPIGASIGLAFAPTDGKTGEELLLAADLAMYEVKSNGRSGISHFDHEMQGRMLERRRLEFDLRSAIAREEMELHYQPLLDAKTGLVAGYEALMRWNHPTLGLIGPDDFVPIAEDTGQIVSLGEWAVRAALEEASHWPAHFSIAVNMSPSQIKDDNLLPLIVQSLAATGIEPSRLELEITERLLMQDTEEVLATLHRLRKLGVRIALDDFGTGYSSLNYLRSFPFDKIKIDRCFVSEVANSEDCVAIIRSILSLAAELSMTTTAEGVETNEQLDALTKIGCDQMQGFLYSAAVPASQLPFSKDQRRAAG